MKKIISVVVGFSLLLLLSFPFGCTPSKVYSKPGTKTTVILIRHADKTKEGFLTDKGRKRALALIESLESLKISAIYSPDLRRNLDTVRPLADHLGIKITLTPKTSLFSVDTIARTILDKHSNQVVLWVGNVSGNLQAMYHRFGGKGRGPLEYGQISMLTIFDTGKVMESNLRFDP